MEPSCKPIQKYKPNHNKMKMKTEYSEVYVEQALNRKKEFECLNNEQLKNYVMNILNDWRRTLYSIYLIIPFSTNYS